MGAHRALQRAAGAGQHEPDAPAIGGRRDALDDAGAYLRRYGATMLALLAAIIGCMVLLRFGL